MDQMIKFFTLSKNAPTKIGWEVFLDHMAKWQIVVNYILKGRVWNIGEQNHYHLLHYMLIWMVRGKKFSIDFEIKD